jgi:hypothetical protein
MSSYVQPESGEPSAGRVGNGLVAASYVPLTDVATDFGQLLLGVLGRARIAAYLTAISDGPPDRRRLFVAADERTDARSIVAAEARRRNEGATDPAAQPTPAQGDPPDPLAGLDTDAAFAELVSDWHVDTVAAVREAQRQLRQEDAEWRARLSEPETAEDQPVWLDDDHFVPPAPPPLPRLAAPTVGAMSLLAISILLLGIGGDFGLASDLTLLLGVFGVLLGTWMLIMRLRDRNDDDDGDDGAIV